MSPLTVVVWVCVAIFLATAIITMGALIGSIRCLGGGDCSHHHFYLKGLFAALVLEVAGTSVAAYALALNSKDRHQLEKITDEIRTSTAETLSPAPSVSAAGMHEPVIQRVLQQKVYATSDGPSTDETLLEIPDGWAYVRHNAVEWTRNGDANFTVVPIEDPKTKEITALRLTATAGNRKLFGPRNWVGVDLAVAMQEKP